MGGEDRVTIEKSKLEELIEEKVEERVKVRQKESNETSVSFEAISRREFLKKAGLGFGGLAALASPVSADYFIKDDSFSVQTGTGPSDLGTYFSVSQGGPVKIQNTSLIFENSAGKQLGINSNGNIDLKGNNINNASTAKISTLEATAELVAPDGTTYTGQIHLTDEQVQDIIGASLGAGLEYNDDQNKIVAASVGPNPYNSIKDFTEATVTIKDGKRVNGSVETISDTTTNLPWSTDKTTSTSTYRGIQFTALSTFSNISGTIRPSQETVSELFLYDLTDGKVVFSNTSGWTGGDTFSFNVKLKQGHDYNIGVYDEGNSYTLTYDNTSSYHPFSSSNLETLGSFSGSSKSTSNITDALYVFDDFSVTGVADAFTVIGEWGNPSDVYDWGVATYIRTLDGETVDVFVEYNDGTGWAVANGGSPIPRNYDLSSDGAISPEDNVRLRVEGSRVDAANNPTIDSLHRSWLL